MAIDSHAHYYLSFKSDVDKKISDINKDDSLEVIINVGTDIKTSILAKKVSVLNKKFYSTIGIHPLCIGDKEELDKIIDLCNDKKVVAIGEIGLDSTKDNLEEQLYFFKKQIEIANKIKLPVIIHSRNMYEEVLKIFREEIKPEYGCVFHCFQPDKEALLKILKNSDYYVSFAGPITFKNAKNSHEIVKMVPLDRLLIETDTPYLSPEPYRGKENTSLNLKYIIEKISQIRDMPYEKIEQITTENTKRLFEKIK